MKGWNVNFHKWKGIWIYKKSLNWFPFQTRKHKEKSGCDKKTKMKKMKKLERKSIVCNKNKKEEEKLK
jgi:hypothetical protein